MIREQYLSSLWELLSPIPEAQRREMLYDYEEHFRHTLEQGGSEEMAAAELGDPRTIAKELLLGYRVVEAEESGGVVRISRAVMATVGLGFFNLVFVLGPYLGLMGILLGLWTATVALFISPLGFIYEGVFGSSVTAAQGVFLALIVLGLGMLLAAGTKKLTQAIFRLTLKYLQYNTRVIKGRKR